MNDYNSPGKVYRGRKYANQNVDWGKKNVDQRESSKASDWENLLNIESGRK